MPKTPKRAGILARPGALFPSEVLARNLRDHRRRQELDQAHIAERMAELGHPWKQATVSTIESRDRTVNVDELFGLALVLGVTVGDLLDPTGIDGRGDSGLEYDLTLEAQPMDAALGRVWARGRAMPVLRWSSDGAEGVTMRPAPDDPITYTAAVTGQALDHLRDGTLLPPAGDDGEEG